MIRRFSTILIALAAIGIAHIGLVFASKWYRLDQKRLEIEARLQVIDARLAVARQENEAIAHSIAQLEKEGLTHATTPAELLIRTVSKSVSETFPGIRVELLHDGRLLAAAAGRALLPVTIKMQLPDKGLPSQLLRLEAIRPGFLVSAMRAMPTGRPGTAGNGGGLLQIEVDGLLIQTPQGRRP